MKLFIVSEKMGNKIIEHVLCLLYVPGLVFHELCHIVASFFLGGKISNIEFLFPTNEEIAYGVYIEIEGLDPVGELIVSSAPIIGLILMLIILPIIHIGWGIAFIIYVLFRGRIFLMSKKDKIVFNEALRKIKNKNKIHEQ